ncbi:MAG: hypothetical protein RLZZ591_1180 [Pseudomonadota bacterium]|jgi:photosystem II stability/assembly factor-like uncharacterized protein
MHQLLLGTRKGLLLVQGEGTDWHVTAHHFAGDPVTQILVDPRDGCWYAALNLGHFGVKLRKSTDQGGTWQEITSPAFPTKPTEGPWADDPSHWNVELIWSLTAGGPDQPGTLWAGCMPAGLFRSDDSGASWSLNTALWLDPRRKEWMGGGNDYPGMHSVLVDPRDAQHVTVAISCGGVWQTRDGGQQWALTSHGMSASYMPEGSADEPNTQDVHALVQCAAHPDAVWVQHHCGIYKSTDSAHTWQHIEATPPSGFGFAVACDPRDPQRAWFVPAQADTHRYPVDGRLVVTRTDDGGKTFKTFGQGLPAHNAYHLIYRHGLAVTPDGQTLAMASTTGGLWTSANAGESWHCISRDLPPVAVVKFVG